MFSALSEEERQSFLTQNCDSFIPGYTGHCPTLKFHYGRGYGSRTKEILKDLRNKHIFQDVNSTPRTNYRPDDYRKPILEPIPLRRAQYKDYALDYKCKAPRYITGYTGFIPTLNFRYGKSYSRAADDSVSEYTNTQRRIRLAEQEVDNMLRAKSAPRLTSIRCKDEVKRSLNQYVERNKFRVKKISPEHPPIAGYTGHIPRVKGNEESLSHRYNTVVRRGLTLLQQERQRTQQMKNAQNHIGDVLEEYENLHK